MYIIKNALTSIVRNKGRNLLIGIIIIVISASCAITLAIRNSATKIVNAYEEKYEVEATIGMDRSSLMQNFRGNRAEGEKKTAQDMINIFNDLKGLTLDEIKTYGESQYVKNYFYYYETSMNAKDIEELTDSLIKETTTTETTTKTESFGTPPDGFGRGPGGNFGNKTTTNKVTTQIEKIFNEKADKGAFKIKGYSSLESMTDFIDGKMTITDGSIFTNFTDSSLGFNCIISEELAIQNDLKVGDVITLVNPDDEKLTYELTISGIYAESSDTSNDMTNMFTSSANTIIVPSMYVEKMIEDKEDLGITITPTFILTGKKVADKFANELKEKGLNEYYTVTNNVETVEGATKSITNVKVFATTFLIITLTIGGVVLFVINMINIRERKYEIGVLRTIGMKKHTVISQFVLELLIVAIVSLLIGAGIGALGSVKVANNLLETEINNATDDMDNINKNFGGGFNPDGNGGRNPQDRFNFNFNFNNMNGMVKIEQVDNINAVVDLVVLLELLGIGVLLTIISSISAGVSIARFSPLTILKERS